MLKLGEALQNRRQCDHPPCSYIRCKLVSRIHHALYHIVGVCTQNKYEKCAIIARETAASLDYCVATQKKLFLD